MTAFDECVPIFSLLEVCQRLIRRFVDALGYTILRMMFLKNESKILDLIEEEVGNGSLTSLADTYLEPMAKRETYKRRTVLHY